MAAGAVREPTPQMRCDDTRDRRQRHHHPDFDGRHFDREQIETEERPECPDIGEVKEVEAGEPGVRERSQRSCRGNVFKDVANKSHSRFMPGRLEVLLQYGHSRMITSITGGTRNRSGRTLSPIPEVTNTRAPAALCQPPSNGPSLGIILR